MDTDGWFTLMTQIEQIFSHPNNYFSACHFISGFGICERLHGHNYKVKVRLRYKSEKLPLDFRIVNSAIQNELSILNQKILLPGKSSTIQILSSSEGQNWLVSFGVKRYSLPKKDVIIMDSLEQTTTEGLASYFHQKLSLWSQQNYYNHISEIEVSIDESEGNVAVFDAPLKR